MANTSFSFNDLIDFIPSPPASKRGLEGVPGSSIPAD
jgi:hypothetical protein